MGVLKLGRVYITNDKFILRNHTEFRNLPYKAKALCHVCSRYGTWYWFVYKTKTPGGYSRIIGGKYNNINDVKLTLCSEECFNLFLLQKAL